MCAKGLIKPEVEGWLGNRETDVDFFFAPFRSFVAFRPTPPCKTNAYKTQAYIQLGTETYERLRTCMGNVLDHFGSYRHENKST